MPIHTVDAKTLRQWIDNGSAVLVDVREPAEHAAENIACATLMPLSTVSAAALPVHAGKKLVIHCRKGARGQSACAKILAEQPDIDIYNLEGGIEAWNAANASTAQTGGKILSLDRQVQLTVGAGILLAGILGYTLHPAFYPLSLLFLTSTCTFTLLLARMPWNKTANTSCRK
jgi:rhodanese-related sulfurtransferase